MPILDIQFRSQVVFARQIGHVDGQSARQWAAQVAQYAVESPLPIAIVMDATQVETVSNTAKHIFVKAAQIPNVQISAVAAAGGNFMPTARVIEMMSADHQAHIFPTIEEAFLFVHQTLNAAYSG